MNNISLFVNASCGGSDDNTLTWRTCLSQRILSLYWMKLRLRLAPIIHVTCHMLTFSLSLSLSLFFLLLPSLQTPLMIAAKSGHYGCVKILIGHGAEMKRKSSRLGQNQEAWQLAKRAGKTRIADYIQHCMKDKEKLGTTRAQLEASTLIEPRAMLT